MTEVKKIDTITELRLWAIKTNIADCHLDELLKILQAGVLPELPICAKTFLNKCNVSFKIEKMPDADEVSMGEFVYFGMKDHLIETIDSSVHVGNLICLQFNMDGMNLFKSSAVGFWPILCKVIYNPDIYEPFVVAVYCGHSKPKELTQYFNKFIIESNDLQLKGLKIDDKKFSIKINSFVCDTPARSFIKGVKYNGGYHACERCTVVGKKIDGTTVYGFDDAFLRTDESFRAYDDPEHHRKITPLITIDPPIDMIRSIVLDPMHLLDNGVTSKLLNYWYNGGKEVKISKTSWEILSKRLEDLRNQMPSEYSRKPRSLKYLSKFKATEFRLIRQTVGPIIFKDIIPDHLYNNFLLLHVATRILSDKELILTHVNFARGLLSKFCLDSKKHYGEKSLSINMHNVVHLADDVEFTGLPISQFSAYTYENFLGKIRKYVRSGNLPLAQFARRYLCEQKITRKKTTIKPVLEIIKRQRYKSKALKYKNYFIRPAAPDNMVLLTNFDIFEIRSIYQKDELYFMRGKVWSIKKPIFEYPCDSKLLNMFQCDSQIPDSLKTFKVNCIYKKLVALELNSSDGKLLKFVVPLLH